MQIMLTRRERIVKIIRMRKPSGTQPLEAGHDQ